MNADLSAESVATRRRRYDRLVIRVSILAALVASLAGRPENGLLIMLVTYWGHARNDGSKRCPMCNDEGIVHTHDGQIIGPCECAQIDGSP